MIDAHLHLQDCVTVIEKGPLMDQLRSLGVQHLMVNATSPQDWDAVAELAHEFPEIVPSFGIHPWKVDQVPDGWQERLHQLLETFPLAGVGEIGLDRWIRGHNLPLQRELFLQQLAIAEQVRRPVTVHCLQAWGSLLESIRKSDYSGSFLLHSYGGPEEMVQDWVALGAYFSISGYFFRPEKSEKLKVFQSVPKDRILLETDAPDMAFGEDQAKYRAEGLQNHPANLELVYDLYSSWSGTSLESLIQQCEANLREFRESNFKPKLPAKA